MTQGRQVSEIKELICEECKKPFLPNGRNPEPNRRFCSASCNSKNWSKR